MVEEGEDLFEVIREYVKDLVGDINVTLIRPNSYNGAFIYFDRIGRRGIVIGYHTTSQKGKPSDVGPVLRLGERMKEKK